MYVRIFSIVLVFSITMVGSFPSFNSKLIQFRAVPTDSEMSLEENDILPARYQSRNGLSSEWSRWPNGLVYYEFDSVFDNNQRALIREAFDDVEGVTCVKFLPRTDSNKDYVHISGDITGCNSNVGRIGGKQRMNLSPEGCLYIGTIIHESLHALGFKHQHMASNRDDYVQILSENIPTAYLYAFEKLSPTYVTDFGVPYDYDSVMHYGEKAFTKNGKSTILPLTRGVKIGQRVGLSISDIRKINLMYKCPNGKYLS